MRGERGRFITCEFERVGCFHYRSCFVPSAVQQHYPGLGLDEGCQLGQRAVRWHRNRCQQRQSGNKNASPAHSFSGFAPKIPSVGHPQYFSVVRLPIQRSAGALSGRAVAHQREDYLSYFTDLNVVGRNKGVINDDSPNLT